MRIIDGGANIGLVARAFHERWPDAEILAVELAAENLPILRDNLQAVTGARVIHGAVWGAVGEVCVANPEAEPWAFRASDVHPGEERVAAYSVTQLLDSVGWPTVDLLKLDIEGAEVEVFGSAHEWIHRVDCIAAELHDRFRPGCREAFDQALGPDWSVVQHSEYLVAHRSESVSGTLPPPLG
jgi:FkbM family methyltransferase